MSGPVRAGAGQPPGRDLPPSNRPPVSFVVCTRDRPGQLRDALEALVAARRGGDQVVVVDSASSTAETGDVARAGGADVVVRCDEAGLSRARNAGLVAAVHPVVVFTDDDCRPRAGWPDSMVSRLADPSVAIVTGAVRPLGGGFLSALTATEPVRQTYPFTGNPVGHGANMAARTADLIAIGGFDEQLGAGARWSAADDWDVFVRLMRSGDRALLYDPGAAVGHEQWRSSRAALRTRRGYARGAGALAVKCARLGRPADRRQARNLLVDRYREGLRAVVVGAVTLRWFRFASGLATLVGVTGGALSALGVPVESQHFRRTAS